MFTHILNFDLIEKRFALNKTNVLETLVYSKNKKRHMSNGKRQIIYFVG